MSLRVLVPWSLFAAAAVGLAWFTLATRELAAAIGRRDAALRAAAAGQQRQAQADRDRIAVLEQQLQQALQQQQQVHELIADRAEHERQQRLQRQEALRKSNAPMPEGVRLCLLAVHDCLRADGFTGLRFLRAAALDDFALCDVELVDAVPDRLTSTLYLAGRMTLELDRAQAEVVFRFFDGQCRNGDEVATLPAEGLPLRFRPVTGELWEQRLPFLLRASGSYPLPAAAAPPAPQTDVATRRLWLDRVNGLLAKAGNEPRLEVGRLGDVQDGKLLAVSLQGYDRGNLLVMAGDVAELAVEVDERVGVVWLRLRDGVLNRQGGRSTITAEGYRMLLEHVTPAEAIAAMLGLVVRR